MARQTYLSSSRNAHHLREVTVVTRAVENVFRKLIRMLIGRISLKKLLNLVQVIFVEETEAMLKQEASGKNVALADLALLTGMDTRTIKRTRMQIDRESYTRKKDACFDDFMPLFKVFDLWMNDERFYDVQRRVPKVLKIEGEGASFSQLVKTALQSRGLTMQLVLKRLTEIDVISVDTAANRVRLTREDNIFISNDEMNSLEVGFEAIGKLADTVNHNILNLRNDDAKYFQRGSWNYQFSPEKMIHIRQTIRRFLAETDQKSRGLLTSLAEPEVQSGQLTAGISMFYFESEPDSRERSV
ncbi:MAG: DUF6502 family protein [Lysobacterales bacterium]